MTKILALTTLAAAFVLSCPQSSDARFRFLSPTEMIQFAEVIAVVDIPSVEEKDTRSGDVVYTQRAQAKIEQILKGSNEKSLELVGRLNTKLCVPDCTLEAGRQLIFVRKTPGGSYTSANSGLGLLHIKNATVSWFPDMKDMSRRADVSLSRAITDIKNCSSNAVLSH